MMLAKRCSSSSARSEVCDVDQAIVKIGESEGRFPSLASRGLTRDRRFPIRLTVQFYKATSNGVVNQDVIDEIAYQISEVKSRGENYGSLVVSGYTARPTEPIATPPFFFGTPPISPSPSPVTYPIVIPPPPPPPPAVKSFVCDGCHNPIYGLRYHCTVCPDFDFCHKCEKAVPHFATHSFLKVQPPPPVDPTPSMKSYFCDGCSKPITGLRYHCTVCPDFDFCVKCEKAVHHPSHPFLKVPAAPTVTVSPAKHYSCSGCYSRIVGLRYCCTVCPNFNFCVKCEKSKPHNQSHPFLKTNP